MPTGFTPIYRVERGGLDITGKLSDRCVSIRVDFSAGDGQEDKAQFVFDDRDWSIARPNVGDILSISMGYVEVGLAFMGSYKIDKVSFVGMPKAIQVSATSSGADTFMKSHIIQDFKGKTLGDLFGSMAQKGGISAEVHPSLKDKTVDFKNVFTSPNQFVAELSRHFGAVAKIANNKLQVVPEDKGQTASGEQKPVIVLGPAHFGEWEVTHDQQPAYGKVKAGYVDPKDYVTRFMESVTGIAGNSGEPPFTINRKFNSKEEAQAAAESQMQSLQRSLGTLSCTLAKGDPWIHDQQRILIRNMRDGVNGSYVSDLVTHVYVKDAGISTSIHAKAPADAGDFESLFDQASDEDQKRLFLAPEAGALVGTVLPRFLGARGSSVGDLAAGLNSF